MIKNAMTFAISGIVLALAAPTFVPYLSKVIAGPPPRLAPAKPEVQLPPVSTRQAATAAPQRTVSEGFREVSIPADPGGQYSADVLIEGQRVHMLVDTGATMVSISASLASRLGVVAESGKPKWRVHTANGDAVATPAMLRNVSLGGIFMNDVEALVMEPSVGEVNLLGASFLRRLESVEQHDGLLTLRQ